MPERHRLPGRLWPRTGIMGSEAGRRVVLGAFVLAATALAVIAVLATVVLLAAISMGRVAASAAWGLANGLVCAAFVLALAFAVLPLVARSSGLGKEIALLELCDPGAPLLRELMERAGGTYNHSIMTGSLAEGAARAIGADTLLARAGAYYHDIGKLVRPRFFAENQLGLRNPHDDAAPEQSAFIITAHVREGVALAERARLPKPVVDIIAQHHGTSLVAYFYRKATSGGATVPQGPFRYDGELPASKEAALVMLADTAEAAVRGLADSGPAGIESMVRRVVAIKVDDGQLACSGLTEEEVEVAVVTYAKMLAGSRHARVDYLDDMGGEPDAGHRQLEP